MNTKPKQHRPTAAEKLILELTEAEVIIPAKWATRKNQETLKKAADKHGIRYFLKLTPYGITAGKILSPQELADELAGE